jgi:hypothetical protein
MLTGNQDNFYYHKILREPNKDKFIEAMKDEILTHNDVHNWVPVLRRDLPEDTKVIPSVWAMRRNVGEPMELYTSGRLDSTLTEANTRKGLIFGRRTHQFLSVFLFS